MNARIVTPATSTTSATSTTRLIGAGLAALTVMGLTAGASTLSASAAPAGTSTTATAAVSVAKKVGNARGTSYLAEVVQGSRHNLVLVSQATGKPLRTVATARSTDPQAFDDADLAPDGTAWVVRRGALIRVDARGRSTTVKQYVTSVRVSPDGTKVAYAVDSPDVNHDRKATLAVRVMTVATGKVATVSNISYPVDKQGNPLVEAGVLQVQGWYGAGSLIVGAGCCDSGSSAIVSATKNTPMEKWRALEGDHSTYAVGLVGSGRRVKVVVPVPVYVEKNGVYEQTALDIMAISPKNPNGTRLYRIKGDVSTQDVVTSVLRRTKATPLAIGTTTFPYKGAGKVAAAFI